MGTPIRASAFGNGKIPVERGGDSGRSPAVASIRRASRKGSLCKGSATLRVADSSDCASVRPLVGWSDSAVEWPFEGVELLRDTDDGGVGESPGLCAHA